MTENTNLIPGRDSSTLSVIVLGLFQVDIVDLHQGKRIYNKANPHLLAETGAKATAV